MSAARKPNANFIGRYGGCVCPVCEEVLEINPHPFDKYLQPIFGSIMLLAILVGILESILLRFLCGGFILLLFALIIYKITNPSYKTWSYWRKINN
jgi:hypothetical protein